MTPRFDPDAAARAIGEDHLVPPTVAPLSSAERRDLASWAAAGAASHPRGRLELRAARSPQDFLAVLADQVGSARRYLDSRPADERRSRALLWDRLTLLHLIVDRVELLMLEGLSPEGWQQPATTETSSSRGSAASRRGGIAV